VSYIWEKHDLRIRKIHGIRRVGAECDVVRNTFIYSWLWHFLDL